MAQYNWQKVTATVSSQTGKVEWMIPSVNTKNAVIAMYNTESNEIIAVSESFKILSGTVAFTSPTAGENIVCNKTKAVKWTSQNVISFDLELSLDGGKNWVAVDNAVNALKGNYSWMVPNVACDVAMLRSIWNHDPEMEYARTPIFKISGTVDVDPSMNFTFSLDEPTPNPFDESTKISFTLPKQEIVNLAVY